MGAKNVTKGKGRFIFSKHKTTITFFASLCTSVPGRPEVQHLFGEEGDEGGDGATQEPWALVVQHQHLNRFVKIISECLGIVLHTILEV